MHRWRGAAIVSLLAVALVVAIPTISDVAYANAVRVSIRITPRVLPADGQTAATITLQYRDGNGRPRAGDILSLLDLSRSAGTIARYSTESSSNGFSVIPIYRIVTNGQGRVVFRYIAAPANPFVKTEAAHIQVTDTSLGTVLEIDKTTQLTIDVVDPTKPQHGSSGAQT
jgi:hypothetical protein